MTVSLTIALIHDINKKLPNKKKEQSIMNIWQSATVLVWIAIACVFMRPTPQATTKTIEPPVHSQSK